jgi:type III secretion protein V
LVGGHPQAARAISCLVAAKRSAEVVGLLRTRRARVPVAVLRLGAGGACGLKIATFPTLLLLTTLFRLALEVSATPLILLHADGGEVIRAFGNFVVAGNLVVGAVIFLILTMIQTNVLISPKATTIAQAGPPR